MYGSSPASYEQPHWPLDPLPTPGTLEFQFSGTVDESVSEIMVRSVEESTQRLNLSNRMAKRVVRVAIEMLQNLHHHAQSKSSCGFRVVSSSEGWWIASRNAIAASEKKAFENRYSDLKALTPDELRALQRKTLDGDERSSHGGGGVGMMEIMRRTQQHFSMRFSETHSDNWILELTAFIAQEP